MRARFAPAPAVLLLPVSLLLASAGDARAQEPGDRVQALLRELVGEEASRKLRYVPVPSAAPEGAASRAGAADPPRVHTPDDDAGVLASYTAQRAELDAILAAATRPDPQGGPPAGPLVAQRLTGELRERLLRAAIAVCDAGGEDAPRLLKPLVRGGVVSREHSALLWLARDAMIREAVRRVEATLRAEHPGLTLTITILDSGTYGTIGSDVDKTPHVTLSDAQGNPVEPFGRGPLGEVGSFVRRFFDALDQVGREQGARHTPHKALDTEFFAADTLPAGLGGARHVGEGQAPLRQAVDRLAARFQALQRNPGPSYQFDGAVLLQVLSRVVEADEAVRARRSELAAARAAAGAAPGAALLLDEAVALIHGPAVALEPDAQGGSRTRPVDVVEFLSRAGLAGRYDRRITAEVVLGNLEKLVHKRHHVVDAAGRFDDRAYQGLQADLAKYGSRSCYDAATALLEDSQRQGSRSEFGRRFGPADADARGLPETPGQRPYTREVHAQLFGPALRRLHEDAPDAAQRVARDLDLFFAVCQANDLVLALKQDPSPERKARLGDPLAPLAAELARRDAQGWSALGPEERSAACRRLHLEASERLAFTLAAGHLPQALEAWIGPRRAAREELQRLRERAQRRLTALEGERQGEPAGSPRAAALEDELTRTRGLLERIERDPAGVKADLEASGLDLARRLFVVFLREDPAAYARIVDQLPPQHREALRVMNGVFAAQERARSAAARDTLLRRVGLDPARAAVDRQNLARLGRAYLQDLGIDTEAWFASPGAQGENAPGLVLRRFVEENLGGLSGASTGLKLLRTLQQNAARPLDERLQAAAAAVVEELIGATPLLSDVVSVYQGVQAGDPRAAAGGALQLGSNVAQKWLELAADDLPGLAAGRAQALHTLGGAGQQLTILLQIAKTSVELVGHEAFEPLKDDLAALALTGVIPARPAGWVLRVGNREVRGDLPVDPIYQHAAPPLFLWLRRERVPALQAWLDAHDPAAGEALRTLPALAPDASGNVLVDLATPCARLAAEGRGRPAAPADAPPGLVSACERARDVACAHLDLYARLQAALRARLAADEQAFRAGRRDPQSLWLLALRENLGLQLDARFARETQLLFQRLLERPAGLTEARDQLAADADEAWRLWRAQAQGGDEAAAREKFLAIMSPLRRWDAAVAAARAESQVTAPGEGWLTGAIARRARAWLGKPSPEDLRRLAAERRLAALAAFPGNRYADARTHTSEYLRDEALAWYGREIAAARARAGDDPAALQALIAERGLVEAGFSEADAAVAGKIAQLRLLDWLSGAPPFSEAQAALRFLWHDLDTQARIRTRLEADLVRSRRLVPAVRAHAAVLAGSVEVAIQEAALRYGLARQAALLERLQEASRALDAGADEGEAGPAPALPAAPPALRLRPWVRLTRAGGAPSLELAHEAELVGPAPAPGEAAPTLQVEVQAVPLGGEDGSAIRAALAGAGVAEEELALALRYRARVGDLTAAPAYLLLLGGEPAAPSAGPPRVAVRPLARGADPSAGPGACARDEERLFAGEPLALLLDPGLPAGAGFDWEVLTPAGTVIGGFHIVGRDLAEGLRPASGTGFPLGRVLPPLAAGLHRVRIQPHAVGPLEGVARERQELGSFEVRPADFSFLGFVSDGAAVGLPDFPGRLDLLARGEGRYQELSLEATCRVGQPVRGLRRRALLEVELPARLSPHAEVAGRARLSWTSSPSEAGAPTLSATWLPPRSTTSAAPTPALLEQAGVGVVRLAAGVQLLPHAVLRADSWEGEALVYLATSDAERVRWGWRLRDGAARCYLPLRLEWGPCQVYGFAAYGPEGTQITAPPTPPRPAPLAVELQGGGRFGVGAQVDLRARVSGGTPEAALQWEVDGRPLPGARTRALLRARKHGVYRVEVRAVDAVGREASSGARVQVGIGGPDGPSFDVRVEGPRRVRAREPVRLTAHVRGGQGPFRVRWKSGAVTSEGPAVELGFAEPGTHQVQVQVEDPSGMRVTATHTLQVAPSPRKLEMRGVVQNQVAPGTLVEGQVEVWGGDPPYHITWTVGGARYPGARLMAPIRDPGEYLVQLLVQDSAVPPRQITDRLTVVARAGARATPLPPPEGARRPPPPPPAGTRPPPPPPDRRPPPVVRGTGTGPRTYELRLNNGISLEIQVVGGFSQADTDGALGLESSTSRLSGGHWSFSSTGGGFAIPPYSFEVDAADAELRVFRGTCVYDGTRYPCQVVLVRGGR